VSAPSFTPGPWKQDGLVVVRAQDDDPLAEVFGHGDYEDPANAQANARLIAAAPELYALLADVAEHYRMLSRFTESEHIYEVEKTTGKRVRKGWREVFGAECEAGQAKVETILAKARGDQ
jgi:hypothetical protein